MEKVLSLNIARQCTRRGARVEGRTGGGMEKARIDCSAWTWRREADPRSRPPHAYIMQVYADQVFRPPLALVAAVARNGVIGQAGQLPWNLPEDRARFRALTLGHAVIMGRRTWDESGQPLEGRRNIVVSRSGAVSGTGREIAPDLQAALGLARQHDAEPMVIGGAQIYREALPLATRLLLSELTFDAEGDTWFPPFDVREWRVTERLPGDRAVYVTYEREV
jgi:dihydrofolate reductase